MSEQYTDLLFRGELADLDPYVAHLIEREQERQTRKLIMIPSESYAPQAVRQALGSVLQNIYAEGYPPLRATRESEALLSDDEYQLAYYRRYSDRRFYKGVEFADIVEALAGRRIAQCFATDAVPAEAIHANVQPLSGSPANLGVYDAFMKAGDVLMGLDLFQGGHLTHGSEFNISGRRYRVASYGVDSKTGRLDYDQIMDLAKKHRPRVIVAGYTSYSWAPDWRAFRQIADATGALLVADIAHTAGLAIAGVYPNPVGIADITVFTTHKTLGGPRGAVILTTDEDKASKIDGAIFPGAQGGPHVNKFAAMCVAFKLAQTEQFKALQQLTVENAKALSDAFQERGLKVAYGGTDTHIVVLNVSAIKSNTGLPLHGEMAAKAPLRGEMAARILDLAGIVVNKNTIPGDTKTALASGIRFGTPWVSQRGLRPNDMAAIADVVHDVLTHIHPFAYLGLAGELPRGKIELDVLESAKQRVSELADKAGIDVELPSTSNVKRETPNVAFEIKGFRARAFIQEISTGNLATLEPGQAIRTFLLDREGRLLADVAIACTQPDEHGRDCFWMGIRGKDVGRVKAWLMGLSDGYILHDDEDIMRKVQGPVTITETGDADWKLLESEGEPIAGSGTPGAVLLQNTPDRFDLTKPYFVGEDCFDEFAAEGASERPAFKEWSWTEPQDAQLKRTALFETHKQMGSKIVPFAGWEMPVWYTSVGEEHTAVRRAAGLFDVSHMGCLEASGPNAIAFLDAVFSNYAHWIEDGQSCYGYLLDPDGRVIDDMMIYRRAANRFLIVVNASNADKDWDWLNAVNERRVIIDRKRPWVQGAAPAVLRNLKDPSSGADQLRDVALQGPASLAILQACTTDPKVRFALGQIRRTDLIETELSGIPLVVARTGYTGEDMGFEVFVHPDQQVGLWNMLLEKGKPFGIKPCGLAARDSTRTEAGLPLYGHELAGPFDISPPEAGFQGYVKYHKPFFIGRNALMMRDKERSRELIRFRVNQKGTRRPNTSCPVVNKQGQVIGHVTSCSIDSEGCLLGLAIVDMRYNQPGTQIGVFVLPERPLAEKSKPELAPGDRVLLHIEATVLPRFLKKGQAAPPKDQAGD
jgi:glycine hydroxymethyltransferase